MQTKLALFMVVLSVLIGGTALFISFLPEFVYVQSSVKLTSDDEIIDEFITQPSNWKLWILGDTSLIDNSRTVRNEKGDSLVFKWWSKELGDGALEFLKVDKEENFVHYQLVSDNAVYREKGRLSWACQEQNCTITWSDTLDISTNLGSRWKAGDGLEAYIEAGNQKMLNALSKAIYESKTNK